MAPRSRTVEAEVETDPDAIQDLIPRTGAPEVAPDLEHDEVTGPESLGFVRRPPEVEIEVERLHDAPPEVDRNGMVEIRMARTIEEFTYGNPHNSYRLEAGKRYRLPLYVAEYLDGLEALYHRS